MKHKILYTIIALFAALTAVNGASPSDDSPNGGRSRVIDVNTWKHYIAYADAQKVIPTGNDVFVVSSGKLYSFNISDGYPTYTEYSTITGLSDHNDIIDIQYNSSLRKFIIAYENGNLDLLSINDGNVVNIPSILNLNTINTKKVESIYCYGKQAYVVLPWSIVIINMEKAEVMDTYRLDTDIATGEQLSACCIENGYLYVTAKKARQQWNYRTMARGLLTDNLLDRNKWTPVDDATLQKNINARINDYKYANSLYDAQSKKRVIEDKSHRCYWTVDEGNLVKCSSEGEVEKFFNVDTQKEQAHTYKPYGPKSNDIYKLKFLYNNVYCVSKGWHYDFNSTNPGVAQVFNTTNDTWNVFQEPTKEQLGHVYVGLSDITVDPRDTAHVFIGGKSGLFEFRSGKFLKHYDYDNSPLKGIEDNKTPTFVGVHTLQYDSEGNLWLANSYTSNALLTYNTRNEWQEHHYKKIDSWDPVVNHLSYMKIDNEGKIWFAYSSWQENSIFSYNPAHNSFGYFKIEQNQDNNPIYNDTKSVIEDIAFDNEGNLWVCGTNGLCYYQADQLKVSGNTVVTQPKVNRDDDTGLADYLLSTNYTTCIVFDAANRRYVGTRNNGVYIISADNKEELQHFNTQNSSILSNNVNHMALDKQTGILYISTDKGLCSVQTDGWPMPTELNKDDIKVFPNPVSPDYTGLITIEGLPADSDIKIVTSSGAIVHRGRSSLSYYQWDGCDLNGDRCASGVYYILLADSNGSDGCVAKVAIIR